MGEVGGLGGIGRRELRDPKELRAMAHPVRLRLLEELVLGGPMTATELGERTGQSAANCSWHLRQLAQYGFVEEAGGGIGRQRPWRIVLATNSWGEGEVDEELELAGLALSDVMVAREVEAMRAAISAARAEPEPWREATFVHQGLAWLTPDELAEARREISAVITRHFDRVGVPDRRPPGSRPVRFLAWGVPARPAESS